MGGELQLLAVENFLLMDATFLSILHLTYPNPNEQYPTFGGGGGIYQEWSDDLKYITQKLLIIRDYGCWWYSNLFK